MSLDNIIKLKQTQWYYLHIQIVPEPLVFQIEELKKEFESVEVDRITWKTLVASALKKLFGIVGESLHFDVLHNTGKKCIIRIYLEDKEMFINSFNSYSMQLNDHFGHSLDTAEVECSLRVIKDSVFIGELIERDLIMS